MHSIRNPGPSSQTELVYVLRTVVKLRQTNKQTVELFNYKLPNCTNNKGLRGVARFSQQRLATLAWILAKTSDRELARSRLLAGTTLRLDPRAIVDFCA